MRIKVDVCVCTPWWSKILSVYFVGQNLPMFNKLAAAHCFYCATPQEGGSKSLNPICIFFGFVNTSLFFERCVEA